MPCYGAQHMWLVAGLPLDSSIHDATCWQVGAFWYCVEFIISWRTHGYHGIGNLYFTRTNTHTTLEYGFLRNPHPCRRADACQWVTFWTYNKTSARTTIAIVFRIKNIYMHVRVFSKFFLLYTKSLKKQWKSKPQKKALEPLDSLRLD